MDTKYPVYALDQRGHGDSDRPKNGYSIPTFAADVLGVYGRQEFEAGYDRRSLHGEFHRAACSRPGA